MEEKLKARAGKQGEGVTGAGEGRKGPDRKGSGDSGRGKGESGEKSRAEGKQNAKGESITLGQDEKRKGWDPETETAKMEELESVSSDGKGYGATGRDGDWARWKEGRSGWERGGSRREGVRSVGVNQ